MMNYILLEVTPDGNGVKDIEKQIAVSTDRLKLEKYCYDTFNVLLWKSCMKFTWDAYYVIEETEINIVS